MDDSEKEALGTKSLPPSVSTTNVKDDEANMTSTVQQHSNDAISQRVQVNLPPWRRNLVLASLFTGLFLSFLDSTIVSVALATIASQFHDFEHATWVVTAYLLAYMSFAIIIARLSDIFGRKTIEVASFLMFTGFSLGCGLSKNMTQLIVFRALQGVGGSGLYSMTMIVALQIVPLSKIGIMSGMIGMVLVLAGVLGPILSGAITGDQHGSTWRWIFYMNVPIGGVALVLLKIAWPRDRSQRSFTKQVFLSVDILGSLLLLAASVLLIFALQEAGAFVYAWNSGIIIACLCVSGISFLAFVVWQELLNRHPEWPVQLVFPMRVAKQRVVGGAMM
jgi:MFS family permease